MKNFSKIISIFLVLIISVSTSAFASPDTQYADTLYELGLFKGTDKGYELEKTLTREESATILVRLLGEEKNIKSNNYSEVFTDVEKDRWSFPYVMYCFENEITKGTGQDAFSPEQPISADQFVTLVLRLLGYIDAEPKTALGQAITYNLLNSEVVRSLEGGEEFTRENMVYIVYRSLQTPMSDGTILAQYLADKNVLTQSQANKFDIYNNSEDIDELLDSLLN